VRALPPAARLSEEALLDHVPALLERIGEMADRIVRGEPPIPAGARGGEARAPTLGDRASSCTRCWREHALLRSAIAGMVGDQDGVLVPVDEALDEAMILSARSSRR